MAAKQPTRGGKSVKPVPQPVYIVPRQKSRVTTVTRLGTPTAFIMLVGLLLVYYALRGWDAKYGTFNGTFAGKGSIPTGTRPRGSTATPVSAPSSPSLPKAQTA